MQREIRRCRDNLVSIGTGVSMFGIWTAVRIIMTIFLERAEMMSEIRNTTDADDRVLMILLCAFTVLFSLIIIGIHLYIGLSARSEGLEQKKRTGYLAATGLYIAIYCAGIIAELVSFNSVFESIPYGVVTIFIDVTVLVTLIELMTNAVRVRKLSGQKGETEDGNAD